MDRIKKWFRGIPIPAAFVICGMAALLSALSLTRATMWFARKNKGEIAESYMEAEPGPSLQAVTEEVPESELQLDFKPADLELIPSMEAPSEGFLPQDRQPEGSSGRETPEETSHQPQESEQEQHAVIYGTSPGFVQLLPAADRKKYDFYEGLDNTAAALWYSVCLCLASLAFYLWKLKKPLRVLNQAARKISENDLNFEIDCHGQDELGRLCEAFEAMRQELVQNNRKLWNSMEERKRLNAAFAHDLRTPLTVLQGHTDLLLDTLNTEQDADGEIHQEILSSVQAISNQITRMNSYLDTMSALRRLEDYDPCLKAVSSRALAELLEETAASLFPGEKTHLAEGSLKEASLREGSLREGSLREGSLREGSLYKSSPAGAGKIALRVELDEQELWMDREAFTQIYENLLSNAARYAKESIRIRLYREQDFLVLEVADDGPGFTPRDLQNAFAPYYKGERSKPESSSHFGLGLYICSLLAGKLGGGLQLANGREAGAVVTVKITCYQKNFTGKI